MSGMCSTPVGLRDVQVRSGFWARLAALARDVIIPYQWEVMNDRVKGVPPSGVVRNFRIAAGKSKGKFTGYRFQDSDLGKWLEAVAYRLMTHPDVKLERTADRVIDLVAGAQTEDGYLDTYYQINGIDKRWTNLRDDHEMYVAGHMLEGAIAYFEATGKRKFLDVMIRNIEHIAKRFGPRRGQQRGYPGHQELELALVKLYRLTGKQRFLDLAAFFINERAAKPSFYDREKKARGETSHWTDHLGMEYFQAHAPVREQKEAVGHAVRAMYMYCGMADVARETGDKGLVKQLKTLWRNTVDRRMYVTGAVGSTGDGEAFTYDYHLPNDTSYAETCASVRMTVATSKPSEVAANDVQTIIGNSNQGSTPHVIPNRIRPNRNSMDVWTSERMHWPIEAKMLLCPRCRIMGSPRKIRVRSNSGWTRRVWTAIRSWTS